MSEFVVRWLCVGGLGVLGFALGGLRSNGMVGWAVLGAWVGFWNACLRPVVLRFPVDSRSVVWWLLLALAVLNMIVFWRVTAMIPAFGSD